jgi:hypothetical protein
MSAVVRFYSHTGLTSAHLNPASGRFTADGVSMLKLPYLAREAITANTGTAQSTASALTTSNGTKLVHVQIQTGSVVAIECNPPNRSTSADSSSPRYAGDCTFEAGPGWLFSVLEIA